MEFAFPEDRQFFASLLVEGDEARLESEFRDLFDFRHPAIKRWEFDKTKKKVLEALIEKHKGECQLRIHPECRNDGTFEPDHIIPLSSNVLNKELRGMKRFSSAKVEPQSFGSNHPRNLTLSCKRCNAFKKNRILTGDVLARLIPHLVS